MSEKRTGLSEKLTELPARYDRLFPWATLDRRCSAVRELAADLLELWQNLGGVESLSVQQRWLCERVVFMRRKTLEYETALVMGTELPMDAGTYTNHVNVLQGQLKTLGLERRTRTVGKLRDLMQAGK